MIFNSSFKKLEFLVLNKYNSNYYQPFDIKITLHCIHIWYYTFSLSFPARPPPGEVPEHEDVQRVRLHARPSRILRNRLSLQSVQTVASGRIREIQNRYIVVPNCQYSTELEFSVKIYKQI